MTLAICFVAFVAGMVAGYVSLRALGWLCVLLLGVVVSQGGTVEYTLIGGGGSVQLSQYEAADCSGTANTHSASPAFAGTYSMDTAGSPWTGSYKWYVNDGGWKNSGCLAGPPQAMTYNFGTHSFGTPSTNYYSFGCVTNNTPYPRRIRIRYTPLSGNGETHTSPNLILPGEYWCDGYTNSSPTQCQAEVDVYDGEGGFLGTTAGQPWWAYTNTPPGAGVTTGSPVVRNETGTSGNTLTDSQTANGTSSTNPVTGSQYVAGVTNLMNSIYQGFDLIGRGLGNLAGSNGNTMPMGWTNWLVAISNNTANASNSLAGILAQTGTNLLGSNLMEYLISTNLADTNSLFSQMHAQALQVSNNWYQAMVTNYVYDFMGTDISASASADLSLWHIPVSTNLAQARAQGLTGMMGGINLNPFLTAVGGNIARWIKSFFYFVIALVSTRYIRWRVEEEVKMLMLVPAGGPMRGQWSWIKPTLSVVVIATAMSAFPILLGGGVNMIVELTGNATVLPPLSEAGAQVAGSHAPWVRLGVWCLTQVFPLGYALSVLAYLAVFELLVFPAVMFSSRLIRLVS